MGSPMKAILQNAPAGLNASEAIEIFKTELSALNQQVGLMVLTCAEAPIDFPQIWSNPELAYEEHIAHDAICSLLVDLGFTVTRHAYGIATSFEAIYGSGGRQVSFNAEYDALPGIGHACGHNLIATSSTAAFLGAAYALRETSQSHGGRVRLLGCPAEEKGGGKIKLIEAGAFKGTDVAMMAHTWPSLDFKTATRALPDPRFNALVSLSVKFIGKATHAVSTPWLGANALDAAVIAYQNVAIIRQSLHPHDKGGFTGPLLLH